MPAGTVQWQNAPGVFTFCHLYVDYNDSNPQQWKVTAVRWENDTPKTVHVTVVDQSNNTIVGERFIPPGEHSQLASIPATWRVHHYTDPVDGQTYTDFGDYGVNMGTV
jgi:hypothetical protein